MKKIIVLCIVGILCIFPAGVIANTQEALMQQANSSRQAKIIFVTAVEEQEQLYQMGSDGTFIRQFIPEAGLDPVISYDGKWMIYKKGHYSDYQNMLMNLQQGTEVEILHHPIDVYGISRDGSKIAYGKYGNPGKFVYKELFISNLDGSQAKQLIAETDVWEAVFSPVEDEIAYVQQGSIYVMDLNTGHTLQITKEGICDGVSWSPDGKRLLYSGPDYEIVCVDKDGSNKQVVFEQAGVQVASPSFSPDGSQILFYSLADYQIYIINSDGSDLTCLTDGRVAEKPVWFQIR